MMMSRLSCGYRLANCRDLLRRVARSPKRLAGHDALVDEVWMNLPPLQFRCVLDDCFTVSERHRGIAAHSKNLEKLSAASVTS